ncbi:hypothetical protein QR680_003751 [Steinernema hermaphroditum]|uniref:Uncharacterized protein n=1 Tax=Steinernema hermaphroditum TaxID=289476 RepID=A0AA39HMT0_9BILA|nr:hypothetical protein QR680_003751 [Steinernema hermaphroditum]
MPTRVDFAIGAEPAPARGSGSFARLGPPASAPAPARRLGAKPESAHGAPIYNRDNINRSQASVKMAQTTSMAYSGGAKASEFLSSSATAPFEQSEFSLVYMVRLRLGPGS